MSEAVFIPRGDGRFLATELARGPWDPGAQHGGAPAALLMRAFERVDGSANLVLARVTYEFVRPVPLAELTVTAEVTRPGRRVQLVEGSLRDGDGTELVRARALRVAATDAPSGGPRSPEPRGPADGRPNDFKRERAMFATDAMEIRFVQGAFYQPGPATAWFRLQVPLVQGEPPTPLQRLAASGDFGNGISAVLSWEDYVFINPDLTLHLERAPVGEWVCLEAQTRIANGGAGISESLLYDEDGPVGRAVQALVVAPR